MSPWEVGFIAARAGQDEPRPPEHWTARAARMMANGYREGLERRDRAWFAAFHGHWPPNP